MHRNRMGQKASKKEKADDVPIRADRGRRGGQGRGNRGGSGQAGGREVVESESRERSRNKADRHEGEGIREDVNQKYQKKSVKVKPNDSDDKIIHFENPKVDFREKMNTNDNDQSESKAKEKGGQQMEIEYPPLRHPMNPQRRDHSSNHNERKQKHRSSSSESQQSKDDDSSKLELTKGNSESLEDSEILERKRAEEVQIVRPPPRLIKKELPEGSFKFSFLEESYNLKDTLLDSLVFLISSNEKVAQLAEDPDVMDLAAESPAGRLFEQFLKTTNDINKLKSGSSNGIREFLITEPSQRDSQTLRTFLSGLSLSLHTLLLAPSSTPNPPSLPTLIKDFRHAYISTLQQSSCTTDDSTVSSLLACLLYRDTTADGSLTSIVDGLASMADDCIDDVYGMPGMPDTLLCRLMAKMACGWLPDGVDMDDVGEEFCSGFKSYLYSKFISEDSPTSIFRELKQTVDFESLGSQYSYFDFTPTFSMGLIELNLEYTCNISRRNLLYYLPSGKNFKIKKLAILSSVDIPSIKEEQEDQFKYPTVLDSVAKLEAKEKFAVSDYDWVQLSYNIMDSTFQWLSGHQSNTHDFEVQTNMNLYFSYNMQFTRLNKCLFIPISDIADKTGWNVSRQCNFDLFVTDDPQATVNDLKRFVNERCLSKGFDKAANLSHQDFEFKSLSRCNKPVVPKSGSQTLLELISEVDIDAKAKCESESQTISYICILRNHSLKKQILKSTQNISVNLSKEELIKMNRFNNNDMLKCSPTGFFEFFFKTAFDNMRLRVMGQHFYGRHHASFWLPSILIVEVAKISANLIDPKKPLDLVHFKTAVQDMSMLHGTKYGVRGFICLKQAAEGRPAFYYPITVDSNNACVSYTHTLVHGTLSDVDDSAIKFVVLYRTEIE